MKRLFGTAAAALALIVSPLAHASAVDRAQAPLDPRASELAGRLPLPALVVLLAILAGGIYIIVDDDSEPDSP